MNFPIAIAKAIIQAMKKIIKILNQMKLKNLRILILRFYVKIKLGRKNL